MNTKTIEKTEEKRPEYQKAFFGVDVGSRNLKVVAIAENGEIILKQSDSYTGKRDEALNRLIKEANEELQKKGYVLTNIVSTGTGQDIAQKCGINNHINEVKANLTVTRALFPQARTIFEIGGTDSKYIDVMSGVSRLNQRCSSSTGTSLENMAGELSLTLEQLADTALLSKSPSSIDATCAVFARVNAISKIQAGNNISDVLMGYVGAMVDNYLHISSNPETPIIFQGGVAKNKAVVKAFRQKLGLDETQFIVPRDPIFMVAYGAALSASQKDSNSDRKIDNRPEEKQTLPLSIHKQRARLFRKDSNKPVVWLGNLVPPELFLAIGYSPLWPGLSITHYGNQADTHEHLRLASQRGFTEDCCSIQRLLIGLDAKNVLETPALIVGASSYCDFERDSFRKIAQTRNVPVLQLEISISGDYQIRVEYIKNQLKEIHRQSATVTGYKVDEDAFAQSVEWSTQIIQKMADVNELRTRRGSPRVSKEMFGFTFALPYLRGTSEAYKVVEGLHNYFLEKSTEKYDGNLRILWDLLRDSKGAIMDYTNNSLVFETVNFTWPKENPTHGILSIAKVKDPYERLARMILSNAAIKIEDRMECMRQGVKDYSVEGIILYQHPHCPLTRRYIGQEFEGKLGVPVLPLNSDVITGTLDPMTKSRVDSFLDYCLSRKRMSRQF